MRRFSLAFACFFRLLFGGKLPKRAVDYLPEGARPPELLPPQESEAASDERPPKQPPHIKEARRPRDVSAHHRDGALALLALLQREGRLVDFLRESVDDYDDADIGAAARDIHRGCKKVLDDFFTLEAVMPGAEDDPVTVAEGFTPTDIKLIGEAPGEPPFRGVLRHHGWRAAEVKLPTLTDGVDRRVLAPAEVEVSRPATAAK